MIIRVPESAGEIYERIHYPAGELQVRFLPAAIPTLYGANKISLICRQAHLHLMELALLSDALHALVLRLNIELILPYLPYSRADRRFQEGDCHGLKVFGEMLTWGIGGYRRIKTLDVHSFRAQKHVGNLANVSPKAFINRAIREVWDASKGWPTILLPDEGSHGRYDFLKENNCDLDIQQASKVRDAATGKLSGFKVPDDLNDHVLIVDDICDGGGTFIGLAQEIQKIPVYKGREKRKLYLYVTHGIFSQGLKALCDHFEKIYTTDSIYPDCVGVKGGGLFFPNKRLEVFECLPELLKEAP